MHTCIHAYIHACMHTCMHACMHAYIRTYIHTYHFVTHNCFTTSFVFPSFLVPATTFGAHYWKKLTCGVIRSFNFLRYQHAPHLAEARSSKAKAVSFTPEKAALKPLKATKCSRTCGYDCRIIITLVIIMCDLCAIVMSWSFCMLLWNTSWFMYDFGTLGCCEANARPETWSSLQEIILLTLRVGAPTSPLMYRKI